MQAGSIFRTGAVGLCLTLLVACEGNGTFNDNGSFRARYDAARDALEDGSYQRSNRLYARLVENAGPFEPRIRLEYAHSLLRSGDAAGASEQARFLSQGIEGQNRAAALSVLGTAEHELGLQAIQAGNAIAARNHFTTAQAALSEVVGSYPDLDPTGALAGRLNDSRNRLKSLG